MPFDEATRRQALVLSARHCCVCNRYRGVKVEVHHIEPEANGGPNTLDNAIALCFDCHCDAGHYNASHPRGTKFSPAELRAHRTRWYERVARGDVSTPSGIQHLHFRYYLCTNLGVLSEVASGTFSRIPDISFLLPESPLGFINELLHTLEFPARGLVQRGSVTDVVAFLANRPDIPLDISAMGNFDTRNLTEAGGQYQDLSAPWLHWSPSKAEIRSVGVDAVTLRLLDLGVPADALCTASLEDWCGCYAGSEVFPTYFVRPLWGVFASIHNASDQVIYLDSVSARQGTSFQPRGATALRADPPITRRLPRSPLRPGESLWIPIGALLAPFEIPFSAWYPGRPPPGTDVLSNQQAFDPDDPFWDGFGQNLIHASVPAARRLSHHFVGPTLLPEVVYYRLTPDIPSPPEAAPLHELDLSNVYMIDRHFFGGSCPHIFFVTDHGLRYGGDIRTPPFEWTTKVIPLPPDATGLVLAELEEELTDVAVIASVVERRHSIVLEQNEYICVSAPPGTNVTVTLRYIPQCSDTPATDHWKEIIASEFIMLWKSGTKHSLPPEWGGAIASAPQ